MGTNLPYKKMNIQKYVFVHLNYLVLNTRQQHRFSFNMWIGSRIICAFINNRAITLQRYIHLLETHILLKPELINY